MRHRKRRTKLSMMTSHRNAMLKNMVKSLLNHQSITTTLRRAKEARRLAEHIITVGRTETIASRRMAYSILTDRDLVTKLFKEIAPLFKGRKGGFTRIIPLGTRRGDGAALAILELTERKIVEKKPKVKKARPKAEERLEVPKHKPEAERKVLKKEGPKIKTVPKAKPTLEEEKRAEKAKIEDKRIADKKSFLKNLRGFFRRRTEM